jgi:hypothetical protein
MHQVEEDEFVHFFMELSWSGLKSKLAAMAEAATTTIHATRFLSDDIECVALCCDKLGCVGATMLPAVGNCVRGARQHCLPSRCVSP